VDIPEEKEKNNIAMTEYSLLTDETNENSLDY